MEKKRVLNHSINQSVNHPAYLVPREPKLSLRKILTQRKGDTLSNKFQVSRATKQINHKTTTALFEDNKEVKEPE